MPVVDFTFNFKKKKNQRLGMVGVTETPTTLAAVYSICEGTVITVKAQMLEGASDLEAKQAALCRFVSTHSLQGVLCSYVLGAGDYSINLFDAPLVPKEEVNSAVRWLLRDILKYPIDDAIVDTFELPFPRAKDNVKMLYAVAMQKELIPKITALIQPSALELNSIDIPELVLKDIVNRHPQELKGCAFVQLSNKEGKLIVCRGEEICITRSFELKLDELGINSEQDNGVLESLALEVQRSFDYINSVFRQNVPNIIILAPTETHTEVIQEFLKTNLGAEVYCLKVKDHFTFETPIKDEEEASYLLSLGATLRQEGGAK